MECSAGTNGRTYDSYKDRKGQHGVKGMDLCSQPRPPLFENHAAWCNLVTQADTVAVLLERMLPELEDLRAHGIFEEVGWCVFGFGPTPHTCPVSVA
jgi:hypothetical protein